MRLEISSITCRPPWQDAILAAVDQEASSRYYHIRYVDVQLKGELPEGTHQTTLELTTNVAGAERLEIPVTIDVPRGG